MKTRPSALDISDPTCGPLLYEFVDETPDQVNCGNSVYVKKFLWRILKTEKENIFFAAEKINRKIFRKGKYIFAEEKKNENVQ